MNYRITNNVQQIDRGQWSKFVTNHVEGNIYQSPEMFQVYEQSAITVPGGIFAINDSNEVLGVLAYYNISYKKGFLKPLTTRAIIWGGPLVKQGENSSQIQSDLLAEYLKTNKRKVVYSEVRNIFDTRQYQNTFTSNGFSYSAHLNYLVSLNKSTEDLWAGLKKDARNSIRKAEKNNVVVRVVNTKEEVLDAYELLKESYQKIQLPLMPVQFFENAYSVLSKKGYFKCLIAEKDGKKVGAAFRLLYNKTISAWYICSMPEYNKFKIQDGLNWFILKWGTENNYADFDFGGAGKPGQEYGPRKYKSKFNGEMTEFGRYTFVSKPLLFKFVSFGFNVLRKYKFVN